MARRPLARLLLVAAILYTAFLLLPKHYDTIEVDEASYGTVRPIDQNSRFAIVTFLGRDLLNNKEDFYFVASRMLTYQLLHDEKTRIRPQNRDKIDWVVSVVPGVEQWKREQLERDGAKVVEVQNLRLNWWIWTWTTRWKDQFAKLNLLLWDQYDRVLFIDADHLVLAPLDEIFETEQAVHPAKADLKLAKYDEAHLPAEYVFLASPNHQHTGKREHAVPPDPKVSTGSFSGGFWMVAPSPELYDHLLSIMGHFRRFNPETMEQSLFNYAFRLCDVSDIERDSSANCPVSAKPGPMPWKDIGWMWSSTWPSVEDRDAGVAALHEKFWKTGPKPLKLLWEQGRKRMEDALGKSVKPK